MTEHLANALDRKAAAIIAEYLHEQDPRLEWDAVAATARPGEKHPPPRPHWVSTSRCAASGADKRGQ
jgi:hypothetical protein